MRSFLLSVSLVAGCVFEANDAPLPLAKMRFRIEADVSDSGIDVRLPDIESLDNDVICPILPPDLIAKIGDEQLDITNRGAYATGAEDGTGACVVPELMLAAVPAQPVPLLLQDPSRMVSCDIPAEALMSPALAPLTPTSFTYMPGQNATVQWSTSIHSNATVDGMFGAYPIQLTVSGDRIAFHVPSGIPSGTYDLAIEIDLLDVDCATSDGDTAQYLRLIPVARTKLHTSVTVVAPS